MRNMTSLPKHLPFVTTFYLKDVLYLSTGPDFLVKELVLDMAFERLFEKMGVKNDNDYRTAIIEMYQRDEIMSRTMPGPNNAVIVKILLDTQTAEAKIMKWLGADPAKKVEALMKTALELIRDLDSERDERRCSEDDLPLEDEYKDLKDELNALLQE